MGKEWNYAELSKAAKAANGPEAFVKQLAESSKRAGRFEMLPWRGADAIGASALTAGVIQLYKFFKEKKEASDEEIEVAKAEIIKGIKEYDAKVQESCDENAEGENHET